MGDMLSVDEYLAAKAEGAARELARLNAIFGHPAARSNDPLAQGLAFGTDRSAAEIIETLKSAAPVEHGAPQ